MCDIFKVGSTKFLSALDGGDAPSDSTSCSASPWLESLLVVLRERISADGQRFRALGALRMSGPSGGRLAASTPTAASTVLQKAGGVPLACYQTA